MLSVFQAGNSTPELHTLNKFPYYAVFGYPYSFIKLNTIYNFIIVSVTGILNKFHEHKFVSYLFLCTTILTVPDTQLVPINVFLRGKMLAEFHMAVHKYNNTTTGIYPNDNSDK